VAPPLLVAVQHAVEVAVERTEPVGAPCGGPNALWPSNRTSLRASGFAAQRFPVTGWTAMSNRTVTLRESFVRG
jgi:hypothetical protein